MQRTKSFQHRYMFHISELIVGFSSSSMYRTNRQAKRGRVELKPKETPFHKGRAAHQLHMLPILYAQVFHKREA